MRKIFILVLFFTGFGGFLFGQVSAGLGFQYGTARVFDKGETLREITEPGVLLTVRFIPATAGVFGRIGMLFPSEVTEGDLTFSYSHYDYILFFNGAFGASFQVPLNSRFSFIFDAGISINDLFYGGSYTETIDTRWTIKLENIGQTYTGGREFKNVKMRETYNDINFGLLGNAAMRFHFTKSVFLELGAAASFDFLRLRTYKFAADFSSVKATYPDWADDFPNGKVEGDKLILDSSSKFSVFKQFTFIPSISVGMSF
jgi:hypothetical protein